MKQFIFAPVLFLATAAFAHEGVKNPKVLERMMLMSTMAEDMKVIGDMTKGATAYNAVTVRQTAAKFKSHMGETIRLFVTPEQDPKSEALPTIWTSFPDFAERAQRMANAAAVLEASSEADYAEKFVDLGKTCSSCHKSFRLKN